MEENRSTLYRTSDIHFGAYLSALDVPLLTTERERSESGRSKVIFVFKMPQKDVDRFKALYFGGSGTVHARKFVDNLRSLKMMCHI